jgi:hypothetical protein
MESREWKPRRITSRSAKRRNYPITPLPYYHIKNALRPWGLASVPAPFGTREASLETRETPEWRIENREWKSRRIARR